MADEHTEYETFQLETAPPWHLGPWGEKRTHVFGLIKSAFGEAARQAVKAKFPTYAPIDALSVLLKERNLHARHTDTEAQARARIKAAWTQWSLAGTKNGLEKALSDSGYSGAVVLDVDEMKTETYTPSWFWFWVVIMPPYPFTGWLQDGLWGDPGYWGDGGNWAYDAPEAEREKLKAIVKHWKPEHAVCRGIVLALDSEIWDAPSPVETYDPTSETWGDAVSSTIFPQSLLP